MKKTEIPKEVFKILGLEFDDATYTSKNEPSRGGGTVRANAWEKVLERLKELDDSGNLTLP